MTFLEPKGTSNNTTHYCRMAPFFFDPSDPPWRMKYVLDSSAAPKGVLPEADSEKAIRLHDGSATNRLALH